MSYELLELEACPERRRTDQAGHVYRPHRTRDLIRLDT